MEHLAITDCGRYWWDETEGFRGQGKASSQFMAFNALHEPRLAKVYQTPGARPESGMFAAMQLVCHPNIVRVYSLCTRTTFRITRPVVITEYCCGPRVSDVLRAPNNRFGVNTQTFQHVSRGLTAALTCTHDMGMETGAITPRNIFLTDGAHGQVCKLAVPVTGRCIYPQVMAPSPSPYESPFEDMAAAYVSLALRRSSDGPATAPITNLWSCGVVLYQLGAGRLPFCDANGAWSEALMQRIMADPDHTGKISAVEQPDGVILYSGDLPPTCRLSPAVQQRLTPLLRLLFSDPSLQEMDIASKLRIMAAVGSM